jgi:hypothetical protein
MWCTERHKERSGRTWGTWGGTGTSGRGQGHHGAQGERKWAMVGKFRVILIGVSVTGMGTCYDTQ